MLFLLLLTGTSVKAADGNFEKVLADKKFDVDKDALLSIQHKYGMVSCKNWNQQAISVKITAKVDAASREAAEKIFARLQYELSGSRSKVSFESSNSGNIAKDKNNNPTIRVEVMMPEAVRLEVYNQFGNCYIGTVSGATDINIEYGSLEIGALKNETNQLQINFGSGRIDLIRQGEVEVSYSPLTIGESGFLSVASDYSDIKIGKVSQIEIESEGGNVQIGEVDKAELSAKFSECTITLLSHSLRAETEYGAFTVVKVSPEFGLLEIENSFGSTSVTFDSGASFSFDAEVEMGSIDFKDFPEPRFKFSSLEKFLTGSSYSGTSGPNPQKARVTIESSYGSVILGF
jgi:sporulation protein YlmC with PRC-barrel domain